MQIGKYIFGMRGHDLADTFDDMCKVANDTDIRNLQFALAKTVSDVDFDAVGYDEGVSKRVVDAFIKYNIKVSVLGCYIDPITAETLDNQIARFKNFIRYAKDFNATVIGTETGSLGRIAETHSDEGFKRLIASLEQIVPVAEKHNVNIGIEPVWIHTIYSIDAMQRILDYFKSDNLNIIFDPINLLNDDNYMTHTNIIDKAIDTFGDKIKSLHLKDYVYNNGLKRVPVGMGEFDVEYCLNAISQLDTIPDIMLDEMPSSDLSPVIERLKNIIIK